MRIISTILVLLCTIRFGVKAQNLQQVTDNGNVTPNGIWSQKSAALDANLYWAGNFVAYTLPERFAAGERPSFGFDAPGNFGLSMYASGGSNLRIRNNLNQDFGIWHTGNLNPVFYSSDGDVSIGKKLDVNGVLRVQDISNTWQTAIELLNNVGAGYQFIVGGSGNHTSGDLTTAGVNNFGIFSSILNKFVFSINADGNIGLGTTSPDAKLTVNGRIHAEEIKVDLNVPGPDYVFEKDYDLKSLEHLETFIAHNKHLPEIPSAAEMKANKVNIGEMQMKLLQKIEELTLYIIEQNKKLESQQDKLLELEDTIKKTGNK